MLIAAGAVVWVLGGLSGVSLSIFLTRAGYDPVFIGLILSLTGLIAVLFVIPFGLLADRFGRMRMMTLGAAANVVSGAALVAPMFAPGLMGRPSERPASRTIASTPRRFFPKGSVGSSAEDSSTQAPGSWR